MNKRLLSLLMTILLLTSSIFPTAAYAQGDTEPETPPAVTYTVRWLNWDGTELEKDENVAEGAKPEYNGTEPKRASDGIYEYTFIGWDPAVTEETKITANAEFKAQYSAKEINPSGTVGKINWSLDLTTGSLTLTGTGAVPDYVHADNLDAKKDIKPNAQLVEKTAAPWFSWADRIKSVTVGSGITKIGNFAFAYLPALEKVTLSKSVTNIDQYAFKEDNKLSYVNYTGALNDWAMLEFEMKSSNPVYYAKDLYINEQLVEKAAITAKYARQYTFCNAKSLKEVTFGDAVTTIGKEAFAGAAALTEIVIPFNLTSIRAEAFSGCTALKQATIINTACEFGTSKTTDEDIAAIFPTATLLISCPDSSTQDYAKKYNRTFKATAHQMVTSSTQATLYNDGGVTETCSVCGYTRTVSTISRIASVTATPTDFTYTGVPQLPYVVIKDSAGNTLKEGGDYRLTYLSDGFSVGTQTGYISFIGSYRGGSTVTYTIRPKATAISRIKGKKKKIYVKWKRRTVQSTGYQVQYARNKKFTSGKKTVTIKSNTKTATYLKNLKAKKTYYVRVRAYHTIAGKTYYSAWSTVKSVKTKK